MSDTNQYRYYGPNEEEERGGHRFGSKPREEDRTGVPSSSDQPRDWGNRGRPRSRSLQSHRSRPYGREADSYGLVGMTPNAEGTMVLVPDILVLLYIKAP